MNSRTTVISSTAGGFLLLIAAACSSGGSSDGDMTGNGRSSDVTLEYSAATAIDSDVQAANAQCASLVAVTHVHPSWRNWTQVNMEAVGDNLWRVKFSDVPTGVPVGIRVNDPNFCGDNAFGWRTEDVQANGVTLSKVIATPVTGDHGDGLEFEVDEDGKVSR